MPPSLDWLRLPAVAAALCLSTSAAAGAPGVPELKTLPNGLRVALLEDKTLPYVAVSLLVGAGSKHESDASAGYAHFLERLIQQGTTGSGPREYLRRAVWWGGTMAVRADYDRTAITVTGVPSALDEMILATADLAFRATLNDERIEREVSVFSREIGRHYSQSASVIFLESMRAAFPDHPYRMPRHGSLKTVGTLKSQTLGAFYRNLYVPNNMVLAVAGDFRPGSAMKRIEAAFGAAQRSMTLPAPPEPPARFAGHTDIEKRVGLSSPLGALAFVMPGYRHPDRAAAEVMALALGDGSDSPLGAALERSGAGTLLSTALHQFEDAGLLLFTFAPSRPEQTLDAARVILEGLTAFKRGGLTEKAVLPLARRILDEERRRAERLPDRAELIAESILFGGLRYYWQRPEILAGLRPADIAHAARTYLVSDNLRPVILLPEKTPPLPGKPDEAFHLALEKLGSAPAGSEVLSSTLYPPGESAAFLPDAWGDWQAAARPGVPARSVLGNGLTLIVLEDRRHGLAAASLHLPFGSRHDPGGKEGLASLLLRSLAAGLRGGIADGESVSSDSADGAVVRLTRDFAELSFPVDPADPGAALRSLAATLTSPRPAASIVEAARGAALGEIERNSRNPSALGIELFREKAYAGHPYAHDPNGTIPGLKAITAADLESFRSAHLRPSGAVLALAGDLETAAIADLVRTQLDEWSDPAGAAAGAGDGAVIDGDAMPAAGPATAGSRSGAFSRQVAGGQNLLIVGVPGSPLLHEDFPVIRLLGTVLSVKAFDELIFSRQSAYSARAIPEGFRDGGSLAIEVMTPSGQGETALADLQLLMRRLALNDLKDDVVRKLGEALAGNRAAAMQGVLPLASALSYREAAGLGAAGYREEFAAPEVTAGRLREAASRYFDPARWITLSLTPPSP
jgi:zinc protease